MHSRGRRPALPDGRDWPRYDPETPALEVDVGGQLGLSNDVPSRDELLSRVAVSDAVSELERCLLVWELLTAVGVPNYDAYSSWDRGRCANTDAPGEKRRIREALEAKYGSVYFSG